MHPTQEEQDIAGQMRQGPIPSLVFAPTEVDLSTIERQFLVVPRSLAVPRWKDIPLLFVARHFFLQVIDLPPGPGLSAVKAACVQEKWSPYLLVAFIDSGCC